ncbi:MAG: hypothetical protein ABW063_12775 [Caulobacter sp.]
MASYEYRDFQVQTERQGNDLVATISRRGLQMRQTPQVRVEEGQEALDAKVRQMIDAEHSRSEARGLRVAG